MFDFDGDFGKVRKIEKVPPQEMLPYFFYATSIGWHECNDKYRIFRQGGSRKSFLILYTLRGKGILEADGQKTELNPGSIVYVVQTSDFCYYTEKGNIWEFYWIHPYGKMAEALLSFDTGLFRLAQNRDLQRYGLVFEALFKANKIPGTRFTIADSETVSKILHYTLEDFFGIPKNPSSDFLLKITGYIEKQYSKTITLENLSEIFCYSKAHLIRLIKQETGLTPHQFITQLRIKKADNMLRYTNMSVKEIASAVGFNQPSNFIATYKAATGMTPSQNRYGF